MRLPVIEGLIRSRVRTCILIAVLIGGGWLAWCFTYANASWQLQRAFPGAHPSIVYDSIPSFTPHARVETAVESFYISINKPIDFSFADSSEPLDLNKGFSRLSKLDLRLVRLTRCRIVNLNGLDSVGLGCRIVFEDCDFSQLPHEQRSLIRPDDPANPAKPRRFYFVVGI